MAFATRFVTVKICDGCQPTWLSFFVIWTVSPIMQIGNFIYFTRGPTRIGIEFSRPRLIWISRKERDMGGNFAVLFSYICPLDFFARISEEHLSCSRICLFFRTLAKRFLICQALAIVGLRAIERHLRFPRNARSVMRILSTREIRQAFRTLPHARTAANRALVRPTTIRQPSALFSLRRVLRSLPQLLGRTL